MRVIRVNDFGKAVWRSKTNKNLFAERNYSRVDRVIIIDETHGRRVVGTGLFTQFNFTDWIPLTVEQYNCVREKYKEIYNSDLWDFNKEVS